MQTQEPIHHYTYELPRWYFPIALIVRLIWPLVMLGAGITLAILGVPAWFTLLLLIVCAVFARPMKFNWE